MDRTARESLRLAMRDLRGVRGYYVTRLRQLRLAIAPTHPGSGGRARPANAPAGHCRKGVSRNHKAPRLPLKPDLSDSDRVGGRAGADDALPSQANAHER